MAESGLEACLEVGLNVFLDTQPGSHNATRYPGFVRGWEKGSHIVLGLQRGAVLPTVRKGKDCVVRFMHEGEVFGFTARFGDAMTDIDFPLLQLHWPHEIARLQVRKHERVPIHISCTLHLEGDQEESGTIGDLSGGGCSIVSSHELPVDTALRISFRMPEGAQVDRRPILIRNSSPIGTSGFKYGCQFQEEKEEDRDIALFVARKIATDRGEEAPHPQVLVLSRDDEDVQTAQHALHNSLYEVVAASGILDLGHRLKTYNAVGILISHELKELSALDMLTLLKESTAFGEIPLFLYGGDQALRDQAMNKGAALCIEDLANANDIVPHLPEIEVPEPVVEEEEADSGTDNEDDSPEDQEEDALSLEDSDDDGGDIDDDEDDEEDGDDGDEDEEIEIG
jgi:hypothetical protein